MITLLPCPFCGSQNVEIDCGSLTTSTKGIDYQGGSVECKDCDAYGPYINAKGEDTERLNELIAEAWNKRV